MQSAQVTLSWVTLLLHPIGAAAVPQLGPSNSLILAPVEELLPDMNRLFQPSTNVVTHTKSIVSVDIRPQFNQALSKFHKVATVPLGVHKDCIASHSTLVFISRQA
jgi:hypothetical protein